MTLRVSTVLAHVAVLVLTAVPLTADTFTPTKFTDSFDGACNADCSLREAIQAANQNPGPDTIDLATGTYMISLPGANEDANATGDFDILGQLTVDGDGAKRTVLDGMDLDRLFHVPSGASVTINLVTIQNGMAGIGGGLYSEGNVTLAGCQVRDNVTTGFGGGVFAELPGSFFALNSLFANNTAQGGGGGAAFGADADLFNTTFSGNTAVTDFGGGAYVFSLTTVNILSGTFTGNSSFQGGGLLVEGDTLVNVANTVISGNLAPVGPECNGPIVSAGHNLVRDNATCSGFMGTGDQVGSMSLPLDAMLGPLANLGGGIDGHRPLTISPLINAASPAALGNPGACLSEDQRGVLRPQGGRCDIGAVEDDTIFTDGFERGDISAWSNVVP